MPAQALLKTGGGRRCALPWAAVLVLATLLAYWPAVRGGFIWDDDDYVTENRLLRSAAGLKAIWTEVRATPQYYPLVHTTFWLEYRLWGLRPLGYHLDNVLLHAANALLLLGILRTLAVPGAALAAAVFAFHPIHVESVAWVTERKNVLSGIFYLAALWSYLSFSGLTGAAAAQPAAGRPADAHRARYLLALALFTCALLCKTVTATLPLVLLLLLWWKKGQVDRRVALSLGPMAALGAWLALLTIWLERVNVGAQGRDWDLSFVDRLLIAGRVPWFYLGKILWPTDLTFIYPRWGIDSAQAWQYLFPAGLVAVLAVLWRFRGVAGRGPLAAFAMYLVTLAPVMGFVNVFPMRYSFVADHFQYLASIGPIALLAACAAAATAATRPVAKTVDGPRVGPGARLRCLRSTGATVLVLCLAVLTWRQGQVYQDLETLWRDTLAKNPAAWIAYHNIGVLLKKAGRLEEAVPYFQRALELNPRLPEPDDNIGTVRYLQGRGEEAAAHYRSAIRIQPTYWPAHNNLGLVLMDQGRYDAAAAEFREAIRLRPVSADYHNHLGNALMRLGQADEAVREYRCALGLDPEHVLAHLNLAIALEQAGQSPEAADHYRAVIRLSPQYAAGANHSLGLLLLDSGQVAEAESCLREAVRLSPGQADYRFSLGRALEALGRGAEAREQYAAAPGLDPAQRGASAKLRGPGALGDVK